MDFSEFKDAGLLDELARIGANEGTRARLIDAIGFPRQSVPAFRDSYSFWLDITVAIEDGILSSGDLDGLASAVRKLFPGNKVFTAAPLIKPADAMPAVSKEPFRVLMLSASPDGYPCCASMWKPGKVLTPCEEHHGATAYSWRYRMQSGPKISWKSFFVTAPI